MKYAVISISLLFSLQFAHGYDEKAVRDEIEHITRAMKPILAQANADMRFFKIAAFFRKPSEEKLERISKNSELLLEGARKMESSLVELEQELVRLRSRKDFLGRGDDVLFAIISMTLLFPFALAAHASSQRAIKSLEKEIQDFRGAQRGLEKIAEELKELVAYVRS